MVRDQINVLKKRVDEYVDNDGEDIPVFLFFSLDVEITMEAMQLPNRSHQFTPDKRTNAQSSHRIVDCSLSFVYFDRGEGIG